ncbi:MAG: hypothetical protein JJE46_11025, partial [Acidimicrobiia bacterium]|nr:hypothetical protein [Acidimicrobiia bacterium]
MAAPSEMPIPAAPHARDVAARIYWFVLALVLVPFVVSAVVVLAGGPVIPLSDRALTELAVRDVGVHPVLLGLFSRDGWSHPGPALFYTLAIPYRIFGSSASALAVGALGINAACIAGMGAIVRRLGSARAGIGVLLFMGVLVRALGPQVVRDPWVLFVTVFPFGLMCCLVWAMTLGRIWALPVATFVTTWLTQTHVGYIALAIPLGVGGALVLAWRIRSDRGRTRAFLKGVLGSVGVLVVCWAPTLWDQLYGSRNLTTTYNWFRTAREGVHTLAEGARVVFGQFAIPPDWVTGRRRVVLFGGETELRTHTLWPILLVVMVVAALIAWRRRERVALWFLAVIVAALGIG